jgi:hypothetical protein
VSAERGGIKVTAGRPAKKGPLWRSGHESRRALYPPRNRPSKFSAAMRVPRYRFDPCDARVARRVLFGNTARLSSAARLFMDR